MTRIPALYIKTCYIFSLILVISSCKKFIEVGPPLTSQEGSAVFNNEAAATASVVNAYAQFGDLSASISNLGGLSSDELLDQSRTIETAAFGANSILSTSSENSLLWAKFYNVIYGANAAIEKLPLSTNIREEARQQLLGESKFIRAMSYFYLVNLYGKVPLILITDYSQNKLAARAPVDDVYNQIIADLKDAKKLLSADYVGADNNPGAEKVRPNRFVATAFLARVYLYREDWESAALEADAVISNTMYQLDPDLNSVFLKNSTEAIFQVIPTDFYRSTGEAVYFLPLFDNSAPFSVLRQQFLSEFDFDDQRKESWIGTVEVDGKNFIHPYKYKIARKESDEPHSEYTMIIRLAEIFLIRSEARAEQGDLSGALEDLNMIRNRAGLPDADIDDQNALLLEIMHERRIELFAESGHRWFDLKRKGIAGQVLENTKAPNWQDTDVLFPIPLTELMNNPNMKQNPGY